MAKSKLLHFEILESLITITLFCVFLRKDKIYKIIYQIMPKNQQQTNERTTADGFEIIHLNQSIQNMECPQNVAPGSTQEGFKTTESDDSFEKISI